MGIRAFDDGWSVARPLPAIYVSAIGHTSTIRGALHESPTGSLIRAMRLVVDLISAFGAGALQSLAPGRTVVRLLGAARDRCGSDNFQGGSDKIFDSPTSLRFEQSRRTLFRILASAYSVLTFYPLTVRGLATCKTQMILDVLNLLRSRRSSELSLSSDHCDPGFLSFVPGTAFCSN